MKIDFSSAITELDGSLAKDGEKVVTLATLAVNALINTLADAAGRAEQLDAEMKVRLAKLAQDIHCAGDKALDLTVEDIALIKQRIGRAFSQVAVMRAWALLDPPGE
jgi:hypothetical protein